MFWIDVLFEIVVFMMTGLFQVPLTVVTELLLGLLS